MFSFVKRGSGANEPNKELQKLKRQDLLELLLEQMREGDQLEATIASLNTQISTLTDLTDYLKQSVSEKDALVEQLQRRIELKDRIIAQLLAQWRKLPAELAEMEALLDAEQGAIEAYLEEKNSTQQGPEAEPASSDTAPEGGENA